MTLGGALERRSFMVGGHKGEPNRSVDAVTLGRDAATLGVDIGEKAPELLRLLAELERWNRRYNLTAITTLADGITRHLLDSLAVGPDLTGTRIADVGTGAGFPGLPLALVYPERQFTLVDSVAKKVRFVMHAARVLELQNVTVAHTRVESMQVEAPFDTVLARAFAPLPKLLAAVEGICGPSTQVLAMKGKWPRQELDSLPHGWRVVRSRRLEIPRLPAERWLVVLARVQNR
ncbi:MAG: 16S rRNA (guanine(527)-N(7))-methyltransferase RsmG [Gammaproteobacteria bacterium]|nr:16S rRNA (guanine(527)-N(7))-methyltransferase RsmG [Gammaproteobacteria bacterium]